MSDAPNLRSILAATDLSPASRDAVARAASIAAATGARLELLHAISAGPLDELRRMVGDDRAIERLRDEAVATLGALARDLRERHAVEVALEVRTGRVLDEIMIESEAIAADLVVLGARGESTLRQLVLGTTAERLLRRARRPMLIVRRPAGRVWHRVLLPVDFSPWSDAAIRLASALAPEAELLLLHAWQVPFEPKLRQAGLDDDAIAALGAKAEAEAQRLLDALVAAHRSVAARITPVLRRDAPWAAIAAAERECDVDLVAIGKHGRGAVEELLLGSVTKGVVATSSADVLVVTRG
jgi:nucleotide-binding universal stress UspA family protein